MTPLPLVVLGFAMLAAWPLAAADVPAAGSPSPTDHLVDALGNHGDCVRITPDQAQATALALVEAGKVTVPDLAPGAKPVVLGVGGQGPGWVVELVATETAATCVAVTVDHLDGRWLDVANRTRGTAESVKARIEADLADLPLRCFTHPNQETRERLLTLWPTRSLTEPRWFSSIGWIVEVRFADSATFLTVVTRDDGVLANGVVSVKTP